MQKNNKIARGIDCLKQISSYYGKSLSVEELSTLYHDFQEVRENASEANLIVGVAERLGLRSLTTHIKRQEKQEIIDDFVLMPTPFIYFFGENDEMPINIVKITKKKVIFYDPKVGKLRLNYIDFLEYLGDFFSNGIAISLEPTPEFYSQPSSEKNSFLHLLKYFYPHKRLIAQFTLGLLLASVFQLIFPFLTQSIVDIGIKNQNVGFIYLILIAQLMVFVGQTSVNFIQNWITLHINTRFSISLISDFLTKLMRLPISFFNTKTIGDLLQRIGDHSRVENFFTNHLFSTLFSVINLIIFGVVLYLYNLYIFIVFALASILYVLWIIAFLKKRKSVDHQLFHEYSQNQSILIELIQGMQEIKLQTSERKRKRSWIKVQAKLFQAKIRSLAISQYQDAGATSINQLKDIFISFIAAQAVINGEMTLGMMMATQYIVGQLNTPLQRIIIFVRAAQDAKISIERLGEIHNKKEEQEGINTINYIPENTDIIIKDLSFKYDKKDRDVLTNINLVIPRNKTTAIVGTSGSGKTTLLRLILGFYEPTKGSISIGNIDIKYIDNHLWRRNCGSVMQDSFIFTDTIANNVAESDEYPKKDKLIRSLESANILDFVEQLPSSYDTIIGAKGVGISQGQKQRILIARAIYKDPEILFFDEATNALDVLNEKIIVGNLDKFSQSKTVVVVAHRLSTVKNADQIVVLERGQILETGTHKELMLQKGAYYELANDQMQLN